MATVSSAVIELRAESAKLRKDLDRVTQRVTRFGKRNQSTFDRLGMQAKRSLVAITAGATAASGSLVALAVQAGKSADALAKTADKLGVGTKQLAGLQLAAKLTGVETNKLNTGLQRLTRRVSEAAMGTGEAQGALKELGLDAKVLNNLASDQQFERIAAAFGSINNQSDKVRLGFKLFDAEGVDLIRTLDLQAAGLQEAQRKAEAFGTAISRIDAKKIELAGDAVTEAGEAFRGIGTTIATSGAAFVGTFARGFSSAAQEANGFRSLIDATFENVAVAADQAANSIRGIQAALVATRIGLLKLERIAGDGKTPQQRIQDQLQLRVGKAANVLGDAQGFDELIRREQELLAKITSGIRTVEESTQAFRSLQAEFQANAEARLDAGDALLPGTSGLLDYDPQNDPILVAARARADEYQKILDEQERKEKEYQDARVKLAKDAEEAKLQLQQAFKNASIGLLRTLGQQSKAAQIASIAVEKALAVKRILIASQQASILAYASQLVPGDPTSVARGLAAMQKTLALGKATAALTAATGIAQISQVARGDAPAGSLANPIFTQSADVFSPVSEVGFEQSSGQTVLNLTINGDVNGDSAERVLEEIRRLIEDNDAVIIPPGSRNAIELRGG